ncbi:MAG: S9 family peptidase [Candidatus Rokuibacteriota bacterium]|nr:MAG: S9 family peptidase [Candidatus Rokubacteria bacterium]
MDGRTLGRREFLIGATAGAGLLLHRVPAVGAQSTRARVRSVALIPRRLLFAEPARTWARISPDGRRLAFLAPVNEVLNLWVGPIGDVAKARPITRVTDRNISSFYTWLHDNRHVVFFREQGGDENWQAFRVDLQTGDILALTPGPGVRAYVQQTSRHFPGEILLAHNHKDARFFELYRVDVATGGSTLVQANDRFRSFVTDRQFRVRLGAAQTDDGGVDYFQRDAGGEWKPFTQIDMTDALSTRPLGFSDDGGTLYWLDTHGRDKAAVVAQDMVTGSRRVMREDAKADFTDVAHEPIDRRPIAAMSAFTRRRWQLIDPAYADDYARLARASKGDLLGTDASADNRHWIAYIERDAASGRFFHYDRRAKTVRYLFALRPALEDAPLVPMEPVVVRARDGLELVCYLSRPRATPNAAPVPTVLVVHGGPWGRDGWGLSSTHQWLANRGYAVLSVNFRGSTGFGKTFLNAANREWGGRMHDDLIDAVDWAIAQKIADPRRIAIYGASYGGYAALAGVTFTPEKFACAVDIFGISNLSTMMATVPPYWKPVQTMWKARMGDYTTDAGQRFLQERSPLSYVERIVRPLLIAQGANDVRVKPSESDQIVEAMRQRAIPVTYIWYSDEGHGFSRVQNRRSCTAVTELFLARHLGGRAEPVGNDFKDSTIEFKAGRDLIPGLP